MRENRKNKGEENDILLAEEGRRKKRTKGERK